MEHMTIQDILAATGGTLLCGDASMPINRLSTDSRDVGPHTLFVPIVGERVNAHKFVESALKDGGASLTQEHEQAEGPHPIIKCHCPSSALPEVSEKLRRGK